MKKPQPVNKHIVCSVCGLDWTRHGENPSLEKCVELLQAELAKRPLYTLNTGVVTSGGWTSYPTSAGRPPTTGI